MLKKAPTGFKRMIISEVSRRERHAGRSLSQNSRINKSRLQIERGKFTNDREYANDQNSSKLLTLKDTSQEGLEARGTH